MDSPDYPNISDGLDTVPDTNLSESLKASSNVNNLENSTTATTVTNSHGNVTNNSKDTEEDYGMDTGDINAQIRQPPDEPSFMEDFASKLGISAPGDTETVRETFRGATERGVCDTLEGSETRERLDDRDELAHLVSPGLNAIDDLMDTDEAIAEPGLPDLPPTQEPVQQTDQVNITSPRDNIETSHDNIGSPKSPRDNTQTPRDNIPSPRDNTQSPHERILDENSTMTTDIPQSTSTCEAERKSPTVCDSASKENAESTGANNGAMESEPGSPKQSDPQTETDADKDKSAETEDMEVQNQTIFEHVNAENDDKDGDKDGEIEASAASKGQVDEDPIDCWPLNAEPKDILSIYPEDNDECIIPDDEKEGEGGSSFPEAKDADEEDAAAKAKASEESDSSAKPKEPEKSYGLATDEAPTENTCIVCLETKRARFHFTYQNDEKYICNDVCLARFKENPNLGLKASSGPGSGSGSSRNQGAQVGGTNRDGSVAGLGGEGGAGVDRGGGARDDGAGKKARECADCRNPVINDINSYSWEAMDFCSEACLARYQKQIGSYCQQCNISVRNNVLGKYCVRFGSALRQFCSGGCLENHKRDLRLCTYCQEDLGESNGVECDNGKKFCTSACMDNFTSMTTNRLPIVPKDSVCCVCMNVKTIEMTFDQEGVVNMFCGNPCLVAYKFVNKVSPGKCGFCYKYVMHEILAEHTMFYEGKVRSFCSNICKNIYIIAHRKIVPCSWCKVKKYNFDMIRKTSARNQIFNICSLNCLKYFNTSLCVVSSRSRQCCDYCAKPCKPIYHLTMSDGTTRNFCTNQCVTGFQKKFESRQSEPIATTIPTIPIAHARADFAAQQQAQQPPPPPPPQTYAGRRGGRGRGGRRQVLPDRPGPLPVITSVRSLAPTAHQVGTGTDEDCLAQINLAMPKAAEPVPQKTKRLLVVQMPKQLEQRNVMTAASPMSCEKDTNFTPDQQDKDCQTDIPDEALQVIPIPIPFYVPSPMFSYHTPLPTPVPFPFIIPVPILIPITKHTSKNIMNEIKQKVQVKGPTDPFEAELLMMAELVAAEKKELDLSDNDNDADDRDDGGYSPEPPDSSNNTFGDDMLQMALKMASDFDSPAVDLEGALQASTITPQQQAANSALAQEEGAGEVIGEDGQVIVMERAGVVRGRRRGGSGGGTRQRRGRRSSNQQQQQQQQQLEMVQMVQPEPQPIPEPVEKPDAHMCLKYTFGVNAWKQWVTTKNIELERSSRRLKPFKTELLQLTSDELNYSLCLFVKEVRKPNGSEYAPDTIYYLCLGIQQYLFENGRIDNIFCDSYYEKFTEVLDDVCKKFSALYNDSHYIVTRVEEEHLWESKQLGAHSPHVLLSTLMFFNTKHFNLTSVDEHMQLSFSHIMKHWKRNPNQPANATAAKTPGSRNVLLRFYPPQAALESNSRKKKVYEQQENEENPLRCPVKLYEFYLSKCPESVKTRNDVFYLMPERSCVPDSPVWYSTIAQERPALEKMLHRVKMVKEINVALLTT